MNAGKRVLRSVFADRAGANGQSLVNEVVFREEQPNAVSDICRQCLLANLFGKPIQRGRNFCAAHVMGRVTSKVAQWFAKMLGGEHPDIAIGAQHTADRNRKSVAGEPRQIPSLPTDLLGASRKCSRVVQHSSSHWLTSRVCTPSRNTVRQRSA